MPAANRLRVPTAFLIACLLLAGCANSGTTSEQRRRGSEQERAAILRALPRYLRVPASCAKTDIKISSDRRWARAEAIDVYDYEARKCGRFAGSGYWLLKKSSAGRWRIVFNGSEVPPCSIHAPKYLLYSGMKSCGT